MPNNKCALCGSPNKIVGYFGEGIPVYQLACGSSQAKQSDHCLLRQKVREMLKNKRGMRLGHYLVNLDELERMTNEN
jgi:hypothetical protein